MTDMINIEYKEIFPLEIKVEKGKFIGTFDIGLKNDEVMRITMYAYRTPEIRLDAISGLLVKGLIPVGNPHEYFAQSLRIAGMTPRFDISKYTNDFLAKVKVLYAEYAEEKKKEAIEQYRNHPFLTTVKNGLLNSGYEVSVPTPEDLASGKYLMIKVTRGGFHATIEYVKSRIKITPPFGQEARIVQIYKSILPKIDDAYNDFLIIKDREEKFQKRREEQGRLIREKLNDPDIVIETEDYNTGSRRVFRFCISDKKGAKLFRITPSGDINNSRFEISLDLDVNLSQVTKIIQALKE